MILTNEQMKERLNEICNKFVETKNIKMAVAEAFDFGMKYREAQIRDGIEIVFNTLHK